MPIETIIFQETHEVLTPFGTVWRKIGGTYKLEEGEDKIKARDELKEFIDDSLKKYRTDEKQVLRNVVVEEKVTLKNLKEEFDVKRK